MKNFEKLKPMSRLKFQILYSNCAQAGWVDGEFSESLYQKYLLRYAYFLDYLKNLCDVIKKQNCQLDFFIEQYNGCIVYLIDDSGLLHPVYLKNRISKYNQQNNNAENKRNKIIDFCNKKGLLVDLFPFPIKRDTKMRKSIISEGYTFREHLIKYFEPFLDEIRSYLADNQRQVIYFLAESPNEDNESTYVYNPNGETSSYLTFPAEKVAEFNGSNSNYSTFIICPPYVGAHAYLEFKFGLNRFKDKFNFIGGSTYSEHKSVNDGINDFVKRYNIFNKNHFESIFIDLIEEKEVLTNLQKKIKTIDSNTLEIQQYLWLDGTNNPGQKKT